jgi:hypothetical protein
MKVPKLIAPLFCGGHLTSVLHGTEVSYIWKGGAGDQGETTNRVIDLLIGYFDVLPRRGYCHFGQYQRSLEYYSLPVSIKFSYP